MSRGHTPSLQVVLRPAKVMRTIGNAKAVANFNGLLMEMDKDRKSNWLAKLLNMDWYVRIGLVILLIVVWALTGN